MYNDPIVGFSSKRTHTDTRCTNTHRWMQFTHRVRVVGAQQPADVQDARARSTVRASVKFKTGTFTNQFAHRASGPGRRLAFAESTFRAWDVSLVMLATVVCSQHGAMATARTSTRAMSAAVKCHHASRRARACGPNSVSPRAALHGGRTIKLSSKTNTACFFHIGAPKRCSRSSKNRRRLNPQTALRLRAWPCSETSSFWRLVITDQWSRACLTKGLSIFILTPKSRLTSTAFQSMTRVYGLLKMLLDLALA